MGTLILLGMLLIPNRAPQGLWWQFSGPHGHWPHRWDWSWAGSGADSELGPRFFCSSSLGGPWLSKSSSGPLWPCGAGWPLHQPGVMDCYSARIWERGKREQKLIIVFGETVTHPISCHSEQSTGKTGLFTAKETEALETWNSFQNYIMRKQYQISV